MHLWARIRLLFLVFALLCFKWMFSSLLIYMYIKYISKYKCKFMLLLIMNQKRFYLFVCVSLCECVFVCRWVGGYDCVCTVYTPIKMANTHKKWILCLANFCMPPNLRPLKNNGTKKDRNLVNQKKINFKKLHY